MRVKTFRGRTMAATLAEVKREFGPRAVILTTRTVTRGRFLGIGGGAQVEITAARDVQDVSVHPGRRPANHSASGPRGPDDGRSEAIRPSNAPLSASADLSGALLSEVGSLRHLVQDLVSETKRSRLGEMPEALYGTYQRLVENEVAEQIARQLIDNLRQTLTTEQLANPATVRARLASALEGMIPSAGPIQARGQGKPTTIALIGPTGVGKTTTIAKLAANFRLRDHRNVGLITIDTYRIAAVDQLRTYAEIIDIPLEVASTPQLLKSAVARMADRDVILIDTAGRGQRDLLKIRELQGFFRVVRPDEIHLVLSSACGESVLKETIDRFREFGVDRVIFTKLDEAIGFGVILSCLAKANARLSYVTTGQDVPDDIEVGHGKALAEMILSDGR